MKYLHSLTESIGLIPTHISSIDNVSFINWIEGNLEEFIEPFSFQTIDRIYKDKTRKRAISKINIFLDTPLEMQQGCIKGIIFHVSRCGSTLLSNCIRHATDSIVLSEFQLISFFFNSIPSLIKGKIEYDPFELALLKGVFRYLCNLTNKDIIIKTSSWNILQSDFILNATDFPKYVFVYRNPIEVIASQIEKPAPWVNNYCVKREKLVDLSKDKKKLYRIELISTIFSRLYKKGIVFFNKNASFLLDYSDLNNNKIVQIIDFLELKKGTEVVDRLDFCFKFYSKDKLLQKIFLVDSEKKFNVLNKDEINIIEKKIYPYYKILTR